MSISAPLRKNSFLVLSDIPLGRAVGATEFFAFSVPFIRRRASLFYRAFGPRQIGGASAALAYVEGGAPLCFPRTRLFCKGVSALPHRASPAPVSIELGDGFPGRSLVFSTARAGPPFSGFLADLVAQGPFSLVADFVTVTVGGACVSTSIARVTSSSTRLVAFGRMPYRPSSLSIFNIQKITTTRGEKSAVCHLVTK